mmetsp:Transcript_136153/g.236669  ORF Transcript_136153/g.236669 Transcript_136153/m.236669 type:complete len:520 (-) Transcript_136153:123-1682(-)
MDSLKGGGATWAHDLQSYVQEKRRVVDEGLLRGRHGKLETGAMQVQERAFDPLLQRYRDNGTEAQQRFQEETARIAHLNRARDIQILREQPHDIITHHSHLEDLAPGKDPTRPSHRERTRNGKGAFPDTQVDYNIVSNLPFDVHHWNHPETRPRAAERDTMARKLPGHMVKDFNIVTNRYIFDHDQKAQRDSKFARLESIQKHNRQNRFDPLTQQFDDPKLEEIAKVTDDAREVELNLRAEAALPPTYAGRPTNHFNMVSNEVHNPEMIKMMENLENQRAERYKNRYIVEHNFHVQDIKNDHITEQRRLQRVAPERFLEHDRGYCILTNKGYGNNVKEKKVHAAYPKARPSVWDKATYGQDPVESGGASIRSGAAARDQSKMSMSDKSPSGSVQRGPTPSRQRISQTPLAETGRSLTSASSAGQLRPVPAPPGQTRPVMPMGRSPSAPVLAATGPGATLSYDATRRLPSGGPPAPMGGTSKEATLFGASTVHPGLGRTAPPPPAVPGSSMGSVYSKGLA